MSARRMKLPVVGPDRPPEGGTASVPAAGTRPDPGRLAAGWEFRFVATGARVDEMAALYRELGFEVVADPVYREGMEDGCVTCFTGGLESRALYTRRRRPQDPHETRED